MPTYTYRAKNLKGEELSGAQDTENLDALKALLHDQGYFLIDAQVESKEVSFSGIFDRVTIKDISLFCRQFSVILSAGITIVDALAILRDQVEKKKFKEALGEIHDQLQRGRLLSDTLSAHKDIFPDFMLNMIQIGEVSGTLDAIMLRLAEYYEKENKLRRKIKSAMTYPMILGFLTIGVVFLLMVKVLPIFANVLQSVGGELPTLTKVMMAISAFIVKNILGMVIVFIVFIVAFNYFSKKSEFKYWLDSVKLRLPLVRKTTVKVITSRFARSMGILLKSGIPIINAIEIMSDLIGNRVVEQKFKNCREEVIEGKGISGPIEKIDIFPPLLIQMIAVGETTGQLDEMLTRTASFFDEEVEEAIEKLTAMVEPAMIIIMAVLVGTIVMAIMLPMVNIMQSVQQ